MSTSGVSQRYIEALASAAEERGALDAVQADIEGLDELLASSEDLQGYVEDVFILPEHKEETFRRLFEGKVNELTLNFLVLLCHKRRAQFLAEILTGFLAHMNERRGIATAEVTSATELSAAQLDGLRDKLSSYSGKDVQVVASVDENLKAGFIAKLGDQVFDGTLESIIDRLHTSLRSGA